MLGNEIVISENPRGRWIEGVAKVDNLAPGICVSPTTDAEDAGGRLTWNAWQLSTGAQSLFAIVDYNSLEGFTATTTTQYKAGKRMRLYLPVPGDELNMLLANLAGTTGDPAIAKGDFLGPQTLTGKLIKEATGTAGGTYRAFVAMEALIATTGNEWVRVMKA